MNKLVYFVCVVLATVSTAIFTSCGDNEGFSNPHNLTDEEIAEMDRQQHVKDSLKNVINADLILEYNVEITISSNSYDGALCPVECDKIAEKFGISKESLLAALGAEEGTPADITGFAIQGTTHADVSGMSNTNALWGHWWDANGDVTTWGESAVVFAEFDPVEEAFNVGQYPGHLTDGQTVKFIEGLRCQDVRVAVVVNVTAIERGEVQASVVGQQELTLETAPNDTYETVEVPGFDAAKTLSDLGVNSFSEVSWIAVNSDGSYAQEYSADAPGFWYDHQGFVGAWGDEASVFTHFDEETQTVLIGQMPEQMPEGSEVTVQFGAMANNKIEMLDIHVKIVAYQDPETVPEGTPQSITKDIELTKVYDNEWGETEHFDVKEELRQAFKMTTYQIFKAIKDGSLKMWVKSVGNNADENGDPKYTGEGAGYWLDGNGDAVEFGETSVAYIFLSSSETELYFVGGNHPDNCEPTGKTIATTYIIECNGVTATYNIKFSITAAN